MFRFSTGDTCDKVTTIISETKNPANAELIKKLKKTQSCLGSWCRGRNKRTRSVGILGVPGLWYMLGKPWNVQILFYAHCPTDQSDGRGHPMEWSL